jgi:uncharacterized membrane protein YfcA
MSAVGGLAGTPLHACADNPAFRVAFGGLPIFTGVMGRTELSKKLRFQGWVACVAGALSGALGRLVGNQDGIRSAAMLGFDVPMHAFVEMATAVGPIVDGAWLPVYAATQREAIAGLWPFLLAATAGAIVGTVVGEQLLKRIPQMVYHRLGAALVLALSVFMPLRIGHQAWPGRKFAMTSCEKCFQPTPPPPSP